MMQQGMLLLHVKWKQYDNPEMRQWSRRRTCCRLRISITGTHFLLTPSYREGAKDLLDEYYHLQGGRPQPSQPQPKKRKSIGESKVTAQKAEPKRRRKSKGPETTTAGGKDGDIPDWVPKTKSWENEVVEVDTILHDHDFSGLFAYLHWTNGKKSQDIN